MRIATPISSLFASQEQAEVIISWSDCLECRDHSPGASWPREELFHTDIQPIHFITENEWAHLNKIRETKPHLKLLSMHMASCCDQPVMVEGRFESGGKTCGRNELLDVAKTNISKIRKVFGAGVELAVENNNFYPTPAYRFVCDADFISEIVRENQLRFLLDIAHANITSTNQGISYQHYQQQLPLETLIQVHLSKHGIREDGHAYDAHELPGAEEFREVRALALNHSLEYLTIEYYKSAQGLVSSLQEAKKIKNEITGPVV
jgi:uncharacterized protein (UPF0276 family)